MDIAETILQLIKMLLKCRELGNIIISNGSDSPSSGNPTLDDADTLLVTSVLTQIPNLRYGTLPLCPFCSF